MNQQNHVLDVLLAPSKKPPRAVFVLFIFRVNLHTYFCIITNSFLKLLLIMVKYMKQALILRMLL